MFGFFWVVKADSFCLPRGAYCCGICCARNGATVWPANFVVVDMVIVASSSECLPSQLSCVGGEPLSMVSPGSGISIDMVGILFRERLMVWRGEEVLISDLECPADIGAAIDSMPLYLNDILIPQLDSGVW